MQVTHENITAVALLLLSCRPVPISCIFENGQYNHAVLTSYNVMFSMFRTRPVGAGEHPAIAKGLGKVLLSATAVYCRIPHEMFYLLCMTGVHLNVEALHTKALSLQITKRNFLSQQILFPTSQQSTSTSKAF